MNLFGNEQKIALLGRLLTWYFNEMVFLTNLLPNPKRILIKPDKISELAEAVVCFEE